MRGAAEILGAAEAVKKIPDGATVAVSGFVGAGHPEHLTRTLREVFESEAWPRDLTLVYAAGQGDGAGRGLNHLAREGLLARVIGGHWNLAPALGKLAVENRIEAYNFPQGVLSVMFREIAAGRPGVFTKIGMNTFIDPRNGGGRLNERTTTDLVELVRLDDEEWLWYRGFPVHVALIRATASDRRGNLTVAREGLIGEILPIAQAAKQSGGMVIAQVAEIVDTISDPKAVRVPGILVDAVVRAPEAEHQQTFAEDFNPAYVASGQPTPAPGNLPSLERMIIGRRALGELRKGMIVNLGIGLPEAVTAAAVEAGRFEDFTLTVESGPIGGLPASGLSFGCAAFPEAIIEQPSQFDFYDGGGLDIAMLGAFEVDRDGCVNVTRGGERFAGVGGFVNISQSAKRLVFCCTFRSGGLRVASRDGALHIEQEGRHTKFVNKVREVCFHGPSAFAQGREVLYVTERAVFRLGAEGIELVETAPGINLEKELLDGMEFRPARIHNGVMPAYCFKTP